MTSTPNNDWQRVKKIFDDALRHIPEEREEFLRQACGGNSPLRAEVESLLASHDSAETFLETPAVVQVAENLPTPESRLLPGQLLGSYEVRELIGAGGMGEVYLGRDTRLNRNVAIKVLRENFLPDHDASRRLLREARAAALLEHPNICQIYEISETPDYSFIVMQYVVGTTLADILKKDVGVAYALDVAAQVSEGLAEAHEQGIVHRDIKPANIIVNDKAQVKILDFGLAKFLAAETTSETAQRLNSSGPVMGTVPFMSPEQLRGKGVDARTDIFSVGAVLYEMLSGALAFSRESNAETISAILNDEPDWRPIPETLRPVLQKCLAKNKEFRYGSARELAEDLRRVQRNGDFREDVRTAETSPGGIINTDDPKLSGKRPFYFWQSSGHLSDATESETAEITPRSWNLLTIATAAAALLIVGASAVLIWQRYGRDVGPDFDSMRPVRLVQWRSGASSNDTDYRVSHDGKMVAYSSSRHGGDEVIYVKQTGDGEEIRVTRDDWRNVSPIWSPDDQRIAYVSVRENEPGIYVVPSLGGSPTPIKITEKANLSLRHWSSDGTAIFYEQIGNLYRLNIATGESERVTAFADSPGNNDRYFSLSPDEEHLVFCDTRDDQKDIWMMQLAGGGETRLTNDVDKELRPIWHPDGKRILYNVERNDFTQINLAHVDGRPAVQVTRGEGNYELIDVSPDGSRLYYTSWEKRSDISRVNVETGEETEVAAGLELELWPSVSPDSASILYQTNVSPNPTANMNESTVVIKNAEGQSAPVARNAYNARWLPDGRHVGFLRLNDAESRYQLWVANTVNGQQRQITADTVESPSIGLMPITRADIASFDFSPDGTRVVFVDSQRPRNVRVGTLDVPGTDKLTDTATTDVRYASPRFSPDGGRIVCVMRRKAAGGQRIESSLLLFEGRNVKIFALPGSLQLLGWAASGKEILLAATAGPLKVGPIDVEIRRMRLAGESETIARLTDVHVDTITISADTRTVAFVARRNDKDDIWTLPVSGGEPLKITNNGNTRVFYANLAWSRDGKTIYFDKQEQINTISMFENFR